MRTVGNFIVFYVLVAICVFCCIPIGMTNVLTYKKRSLKDQ